MDEPIEAAGTRGFADQADLGRNAVWRAALALLLILGGTVLLVRLAIALYQALGYGDALRLLIAPAAAPARFTAQLLAFVLLMFSIVAMLPLMRLVLPWLHRRPWRSFLTGNPRFAWPLFARSFGAMLVLSLAALLLDLVFAPGSLSRSADWQTLLVFAPVAVVLLGLQALTEEIFFRGYLAQLTGRVTRLWLIRLLVPALLFAAAHGYNPEARYDLLWASANYLLLALYLGAISLKGNGLEASFGAHLAININAALIVGSSISVSPGPTLWQSGAPDFKIELASTALLVAFHYALVFGLPMKLQKGMGS